MFSFVFSLSGNGELTEQLFAAIEAKDFNAVKAIWKEFKTVDIKMGHILTFKEEGFSTPLERAVVINFPEAVELFLDSEFAINSKGFFFINIPKRGKNQLRNILENASTEMQNIFRYKIGQKLLYYLRKLVEGRLTIAERPAYFERFKTYLEYAKLLDLDFVKLSMSLERYKSEEIILRLLLAKYMHTDFNTLDYNGENIMFFALSKKDENIIQFLFDNGWNNFKVYNKKGNSILKLAFQDLKPVFDIVTNLFFSQLKNYLLENINKSEIVINDILDSGLESQDLLKLFKELSYEVQNELNAKKGSKLESQKKKKG